jgi:hypothetical protein
MQWEQETTTNTEAGTAPVTGAPELDWGADAPRGGKSVMNRILKEKATVPLFFAQTLVQSMRDVGYNHTTSALCEHVDNAVQARATEIRVYFRQEGRGTGKKTDVAVYDQVSAGPRSRPAAPNITIREACKHLIYPRKGFAPPRDDCER